jgi:two-component system sensor kinase
MALAQADAARRRFESLFQFDPAAYLVTTPTGVITAANQAAEALLGAPAGDLAGMSLAVLVGRTDRAEFRLHQEHLVQTGGLMHWEMIVRPLTGGPVPVEVMAGPFVDPHTGAIAEVRWRLLDIRERRAAQEAQEALLARLRELAARLQVVREDEQAHLARRVHDELGGTLTAIKMNLAGVRAILGPGNGAEAGPRLDDTAALVDSAMQSARAIATELRPAVLDRLGLVAAVGWSLERFEARTGLTCSLKVNPGSSACPSDVALVVFQVLQELLTNVARHAHATEVEVRLYQEGAQLVLSVRDNGRGMTPADRARVDSLGLLGIEERLRQFGGRLDIESGLNAGTLARISIPLIDPPSQQDTSRAGGGP